VFLLGRGIRKNPELANLLCCIASAMKPLFWYLRQESYEFVIKEPEIEGKHFRNCDLLREYAE
jgi:hypothetical protein